jgi:tRNA(Met) C34 N-acetyltransferase TmcA
MHFVPLYVEYFWWLSIIYRFWKRAGYVPLYLRQTQSELTGEHTCVMVRGLSSSTEFELEWLSEFAKGLFSPLLASIGDPT